MFLTVVSGTVEKMNSDLWIPPIAVQSNSKTTISVTGTMITRWPAVSRRPLNLLLQPQQQLLGNPSPLLRTLRTLLMASRILSFPMPNLIQTWWVLLLREIRVGVGEQLTLVIRDNGTLALLPRGTSNRLSDLMPCREGLTCSMTLNPPLFLQREFVMVLVKAALNTLSTLLISILQVVTPLRPHPIRTRGRLVILLIKTLSMFGILLTTPPIPFVRRASMLRLLLNTPTVILRPTFASSLPPCTRTGRETLVLNLGTVSKALLTPLTSLGAAPVEAYLVPGPRVTTTLVCLIGTGLAGTLVSFTWSIIRPTLGHLPPSSPLVPA